MIANGARFLGPIKYKSRFAGPKRAFAPEGSADPVMAERFGYIPNQN